MRLRIVLAFILAAAAVVVLPGRAYACSCAPQPSDARAIASSAAVFAGTTVGVDDPQEGKRIISSGAEVTWTFTVDTVVKGEVGDTQEVRSAAMEVSCGYEFEEGERYLVFAHEGERDESKLFTSICSNTRRIAADLAVEGGQPRTDSSAVPPRPPEAAGEPRFDLAVLIGIPIAVALLGAGLFMWRRRPRGER